MSKQAADLLFIASETGLAACLISAIFLVAWLFFR
jgi:hypothetical protein